MPESQSSRTFISVPDCAQIIGDSDSLVDIKEIARILGCSTKTVRRKVDKGIVPAIQPDGPGTLLRFDASDVVQAVKQTELCQPGEPVGVQVSTQTQEKEEKLPGRQPLWKTRKQN